MVAPMVVFIYFSTSLGYIGSIMGGALAGTFGTITFLQQKIPSWRESLSNVRVGIGLDPSGSENLDNSPGGDVPGVATWDEVGTGLGWSSGYSFPWIRTQNPPKVKPGGYRDIQLRHNKRNNGVPTYLAIAASGNNSICVSYLTVTDISGKSRGWVGDFGAACGGPWFYSAQMVGTTSNYKPRCVWIKKQPEIPKDSLPVSQPGKDYPQGMGIHLPDFSGNLAGLIRQYKANPSSMCGSQPRFSFYKEFQVGKDVLPIFRPALEYNEDGSDKNISRLYQPGWSDGHRRGTPLPWKSKPNPFGDYPPRPVWFDNKRPPHAPSKRDGPLTAGNQTGEFDDTIVLTGSPEHQTTELCGSPTSVGPSLVNTQENKFCDMRSKESFPVCDDRTSCACLDLGSYSSAQGFNDTFSSPSNRSKRAANSIDSDTANEARTAPFLRTCKKNHARDTSSGSAIPSGSFENVIVWP